MHSLCMHALTPLQLHDHDHDHGSWLTLCHHTYTYTHTRTPMYTKAGQMLASQSLGRDTRILLSASLEAHMTTKNAGMRFRHFKAAMLHKWARTQTETFSLVRNLQLSIHGMNVRIVCIVCTHACVFEFVFFSFRFLIWIIICIRPEKHETYVPAYQFMMT